MDESLTSLIDPLLDHFCDYDPDDIPAEDLFATTMQVIKLRNSIEAYLSRAAASMDNRGIARRRGATSTGQLLISNGVAPYAAYRWIRDGHAMRDLPTLASDAADGGLSSEHVDAVVKGLSHIEARVALDERRHAEVLSKLMTQAHTSPPGDVATKARELAIALAPQVEREIPIAEDRSLNEAHAALEGDGRVHGHFDLDCVVGEKILSLFSTLSRGVREPDGSPDARSMAQRAADAVETIVDGYLQSDVAAPATANMAHVTMTMVAPDSVVDAVAAGSEEVPRLAFSGPVSRATAEMVCCDSVITAMFVDGESVPLDVKRKERYVTPDIRKALIHRDQGCAFPGCGQTAGMTDAHHIQTWLDGGDTSLQNCVLLCRRHHHAVHHLDWEVYIGDDGHPWFRPPTEVDAQRVPLRSHRRRTLTSLPNAA